MKLVFIAALCLAGAPDQKGSQPKSLPPLPDEIRHQAGQAVDKGIDYLRRVQNPDGSFGDADFRAPITGLVIAAVLRTGHRTTSDPTVERGIAFLAARFQPDGGIDAAGGNRNYSTAIALMALAEANRDGRYQKLIDRGVGYLKHEQWDEEEGITPSSPKYGGAGYGRKSRPDLSNTSFMLEALDSAGLPKNDPAYQRAIVFVRRCQNLSGEGANDLPQGSQIKDGGFYYTAAEDYNPGGGNLGQGLRSYGSMTYAGLKSFLHAGVDKDDFRVRAAYDWARSHYTVEENPGLGSQGLFYYYQTFAKALAAMGTESITDQAGKKHDWRADLIRAVVARQRPDGSWTNSNPRWLESDPRLTTAYALLALGNALR